MPYQELVLNKKVLILFSTMDRMNKISTFIPHISVSQHLIVLKYLNIPLYAQCLFGRMCRKV